jgi:phospholipid/cholesterol/gamma-HCH transport system permease protein
MTILKKVIKHMLYALQYLGKNTIAFLSGLGRSGVFLITAIHNIFFSPYLLSRTIKSIYFIGVKTIVVIALTGLFTGMVLSLQIYYVLVNFGAESQLGTVVALSLIRELGPVIAALMVIGRAGSALTAELGIMRITEQIDALDSMALDPYKYLVTPKILAGIISMPILTAIFILVGTWGGYLVGVELTGLSSGTYYGSIKDAIVAQDLYLSLIKSLSFGLLITWICSYKGFFAGLRLAFGAEGVSKATTQAVVLSSVVILICDYFITSVMIFM